MVVGLVIEVFLGWVGAVVGAGAGGAGVPNKDVPRDPKIDLGAFILKISKIPNFSPTQMWTLRLFHIRKNISLDKPADFQFD